MQIAACTTLALIPILALWMRPRSTMAGMVHLSICFATQALLIYVEAQANVSISYACAWVCGLSYLAQLAFDPDQTGFFHHKRTRMPFCLSALALASTLAYLPFIGIMTPSMFAALSYMRHIANRERYLKSQQKELLTLRETLVAYSANLHNETIYQHASSTLPTRKKA